MDALLQDLRYSLRRLIRAPGFTLIAVLTLSLGIGANTAIFSLVNALLLKPPAGVTEPARLATVFTSDYSSSLYSSSSYPDYEDFRRDRTVFSDAAAVTNMPVNLVRARQVERLTAELVTPNYFAMLGMRPAAGRLFADTDMAEAAPVVVVSESAWRSRFAGDPGLVGSTVQVNGQPFTVIGIAAPHFFGLTSGMRMDVWVPLPFAQHLVGDYRGQRGDRGLMVFARLAPHVSFDAAQARMRILQNNLFASYPDSWTNLAGKSRTITVMSERAGRVPPDQRGTVFTLAGVLLGAVAFVLLICCANVANLLLARGAGRQREIVIRYSLGAPRRAVLRQLLTESVLLAAAGGAAGIMIAIWATDLLVAGQGGARLPFFLDTSLDVRVLGFTLLVSAMTAALFGLVPALHSTRTGLGTILKTERTLTTGRRPALRDLLVAVQIALALVLSIGAGLLARTLHNARAVDVGLNIDRVVTARMDLHTQGYDEARARAFQRDLRARLEASPEVAGVTYAGRVPIADASGRRGVRIPGYAPQPGEEMEFPFNVVAADYFEKMRLPILDGRSFADVDRAGAPAVVIVNEAFARRFWRDDSPLGKQVQMGNGPPLTVVGVARNGKYWSIAEQPRPYFYLPSEQNYAPLQLHVRARASEARVQAIVRETVRQLDPLLPILSLGTMSDQMMGALVSQRMAGALVGIFAVLAVLLAAVGVYGVTSVLVVQRVPEIGLRVALGANTKDVLRLVVGRAMLVAGAGIVGGAALAAIGTRAVESMLFGISRFDPASFAIAAVLLAASALFAAYLPARRAARIQPLVALTR
jgi:predicted permease